MVRTYRSSLSLDTGNILVAGGTGSFGPALVRSMLARYPGVKRWVLCSREELKQVQMAEHNPCEVIKTNVLGAQNLIETWCDCDFRRVVALSADKAVRARALTTLLEYIMIECAIGLILVQSIGLPALAVLVNLT